MNYNSKITGRMISQMRMEKGMSQEVLSGLAGIARSHLAMIETGRKNANVDTLWRIANALGMPLSELIRLVENTMEQESK